MKRAHRVLVEMTFDKKVTDKFAARVIKEALNSVEFETYDLGPGEPRVLNHNVKEAERVIQAELRNRWKVLTSRNSADRLGQSDGGSSEGEA